MISFKPEFNPGKPTKDSIVSMFINNPESVEAITAFRVWYEEKQKEADESGSLYSRVKFNIEVVDLLIDAKIQDAAQEYLDQIWVMLQNEMSQFKEDEESPELCQLFDAFAGLSKRMYDL